MTDHDVGSHDVDSLDKLLKQMREDDPTFRVYGSDAHKYRTGPPFPENELSAFEQQHKLTLPTDYRFFLQHVGGRAGPGCGLTRPDATIQGYDFGRTFPFTETADSEKFPETKTWGIDEPFPGLLCIGYYGGAEITMLVVNGPAYGTVWKYDSETGIQSTHLSFGEWYLRWTKFLRNDVLPQIARDRITEQVRVGMPKAEVIALCGPSGGSWKEKPFTENFYDLSFVNLHTKFRMIRADGLERSDTVKRVLALGFYEK